MITDLPLVVRGQHVSLRAIDREDYADFYEWRADINASQLLTSTSHIVVFEEFAEPLERLLTQSITLFVADTVSGEAVGYVQAYGISMAEGWCYVSVYISQAARGQTAGREAGLAFFDHLLTDYTFRKLYIDVYEFNRGWLDGSGGEELGLVKEEGHFRGHVRRDGRLWDVHRYAIYRDRWIQIRDFIRALYREGEEQTVRELAPLVASAARLSGKPTLELRSEDLLAAMREA